MSHLSEKDKLQVAENLVRLPLLTPPEYERFLIREGYRGQETARRTAAVMVYRHLQRLRRVFIEEIPPDILPPRTVRLFVGASGCGKTLLVELIAKICGLPCVIVNATQYSETGYVGNDVCQILSELYQVAGKNLAWASIGLVCMDEFDKVACKGDATRRDVSGFGVQRELLNLLSGTSAQFPTTGDIRDTSSRKTMPLENTLWILAGAFSGLQNHDKNKETSMGFTGCVSSKENRDVPFGHLSDNTLESVAAFSNYGIMPEIMGRCSGGIVPFQPLTDDDLHAILSGKILQDYKQEFRLEGLQLDVSQEVQDKLVQGALQRHTGARGLFAVLQPIIEEAAFACFGHSAIEKVRLVCKDNRIVYQAQPMKQNVLIPAQENIEHKQIRQ